MFSASIQRRHSKRSAAFSSQPFISLSISSRLSFTFNTLCACPNVIILSVVENATVKWSLRKDSIRENTGFARCDGWYSTGPPSLKLKVYLAPVCESTKLASN